jgi:hypothetical protein
MRAGVDSHQQRLRLSDLGHFPRRRKAFERRREDGVGIRAAAGRLTEFGRSSDVRRRWLRAPCCFAIAIEILNASSADAASAALSAAAASPRRTASADLFWEWGGHRREMAELGRTVVGGFDEFACALDLT